MSDEPCVSVCVVTYMRPIGLARLLGGLNDLDSAGTALNVVVVDNDASGSSQHVVDLARSCAPFDIEYIVEGRRGITYARNTALRHTLAASPDWIVWLDDDEVPRADWLACVLATQRATDADVVIGPSEPTLEPGGSPTIGAADAFRHERFETGQEFPFFHTRTSGVLVRAASTPDEGFDDRLALTGGEDRLFFTHIHRAGGRFVWDDRAIVDEYVPASRQQPSWLMRRWFRIGVTRSLIMLIIEEPGWPRRLRRVAGGIAIAARGLVDVLAAIPRGRAAVLLASRLMLIGVGASVGALGVQYREYRNVHGR